ncbi:Glucose-6-phosphate exchanger SLC37A2 [Amphibalanus amphitrite]|uniref:Glucose-6-phosphate exchanger SLC37A2 n=1 Tax=Amphibalanus amphitrite TaxID=1232801 RepID=A0A6A4VYD6_AMPAM|nr:Glucose-6-phosphate exchanger SLC37A2 [Amphibalanus amphitrite]
MAPLQVRQFITFCLLWVGYALTYFLRKPLGVIKADLRDQAGLNEAQLGWMDAALLAPYALAQMALAPAGQRLGARRTLGLGLLAAGGAMLPFGLVGGPGAMAMMLALNGAAQSCCWPACARSLAEWFPDNRRNSVFGLFGTSAFGGGILGTAVAVYLQGAYGWRLVHLIPSLLCMSFGLLVLLVLYSPEELGVAVHEKDSAVTKASPPDAAQRLTWRDVWQIPVIPEVAVSLFFLKLVRYAMYMWLPMFLSQQLHYGRQAAGLLSLSFDVGAVLGSAVIGVAVDRVFAGRALTGCLLSVVASTLSLLLFSLTSGWGAPANGLLLLVAGLFNGGPDTLLGAAIPTELGQRDERRAAQAASGAVNGFGSVGTFLEGPLLGAVALHLGWPAVFYSMVLSSALAVLCVLRADAADRRWRRCRVAPLLTAA